MSRGGEPTLMEVRKRHNIAVGQRQHVPLARKQPLLAPGPHAEKTIVDKALYVLEGDVRAAPRIHWKMETGRCELDGG